MKEKRYKKSAYTGRRLSKRAIIIIAIAAYLLVILIGTVFIVLVPFFDRKDRMLELAREHGEYTITTFSDYSSQPFGTEYYLFREDRRLVTSDQPYMAVHGTSELRAMVPQLIANDELYMLTRLSVDDGSGRLVTLAGKRVTAKSGMRFASYIVHDLSDMTTTIIIFAGIFTLVYAISVFLIIYINRQHRLLRTLQRDLISNVSHELKTPITSIRAMGELIYDGMYNSENDLKRYSHTILIEAEKLNTLVREIMNLSQLQSHRTKFNKTVTYADGIFPPVIDHYMMICSDLGLTIDTSRLDFKKIPALYTDPDQIIRVWRVLLDNAIKFAGKGGHIRLSQKIESSSVTFITEDDGPGISQQDIKRVFERFYKADVTHNSEGSGLGLAIAHEIILGLNEKIWVESTEGRGSSFYFTVSFR